ncbi:MAG: hypothetical protein JO127_17695 [Caulobacteraceae bacterium]|nr:hypothetical protein [Caulobacteraceae bacterium]
MTAWRSIDEFCDAARATASKGDLNSALEMIVRFVITVISRDSSLAEVFSSPELDRLALELGRLPAKSEFQGSDEDQVVFLVTGIAPTGGHSRVLLDLIAADPAARATVLITNTEHDLRQSDVEGMFEFHGGAVEVAPVGNLATRLRWLQRRLASLRPARTYIFTHHFDPLCVAAAQPEISGRLFYYHNCDHSLALGVHLPHGTHIDFNGKSFHHCRQTKGVSNNIFWPLTAQVSKHRADLPFLTTGSLITCTSGGIGKVDNEHLYERIPYLYSYLKIVPLILN